jgi:hypothetical protein
LAIETAVIVPNSGVIALVERHPDKHLDDARPSPEVDDSPSR